MKKGMAAVVVTVVVVVVEVLTVEAAGGFVAQSRLCFGGALAVPVSVQRTKCGLFGGAHRFGHGLGARGYHESHQHLLRSSVIARE